MPIDDSISLNAASAEDLDALYQKEVIAKQIVAGINALQQQATQAVNNIQAVNNKLYAGVSPLGTKGKKHTLPINSGAGVNAGGAPQFGSSPIGGAPTGNTPIGFTQKLNKLQHQVNNQQKTLNQIQQQYANAQQLFTNPVNFLQNKFQSLLGKAGIAGMTALFGVEVVSDIIDVIKDQFGPGGLFDVRKLVLDQTKQFLPEDQLKYYRSGEIYFANVRGQISQLPPSISNTESLVDGAMKYQALNAGY
jgi:hypothetical protein